MILDALAHVAAATPFDLEAVRPGPGQPIKCYANGTPAALITILTGPTNTPATALMTVTIGAEGMVEFHLPSDTEQWIQSDVAFDIVMDAQTNQ